MGETLHPTDDTAICTLARERFMQVQTSEARQRERERREQRFASQAASGKTPCRCNGARITGRPSP